MRHSGCPALCVSLHMSHTATHADVTVRFKHPDPAVVHDDLRTVARALMKHEPWQSGDISVTVISGGITNQLFRLATGDEVAHSLHSPLLPVVTCPAHVAPGHRHWSIATDGTFGLALLRRGAVWLAERTHPRVRRENGGADQP